MEFDDLLNEPTWLKEFRDRKDVYLNTPGHVYCIEMRDDKLGVHFHKIGFSRKAPKKRLKELQTGNPVALKVVWSKRSKYAYAIEQHLHVRLAKLHMFNEWFYPLKVEDLPEMCKQIENSVIKSMKKHGTYS